MVTKRHVRGQATGICALALLLAGCTLTPSYQRPKAPIPDHYAGSQAGDKPSRPVASIGWKSYFTDPALKQLVGIALANNRDLRMSALNVQKAAAEFRIQDANLYPGLDVNASNEGVHVPKGTYETSATEGETYHDNNANVGISAWEIDFFGRLRSLKNESLHEYLSEVATQRSEQISLVAEVAEGYLSLAADQSELALSQHTFASQQQTLKLQRLALANGNIDEQDIAQTEMTVREAQADVAQYKRAVAEDVDSLQLLLGAPVPQEIIANARLEKIKDFRPLPAGLPSQLLTQRPDIIAAEETLKASNADIGAARAAFFPSISLTATAGSESSSLGHLFAGGQGAWTFSPSINLPIFDWGSRQASLDVSKIEKRSDIADYEKTIQTAFREVSDALASRTTYADELKAREQDQAASQRYFDLARLRYNQGEDSSLTLLDAQRSLFDAQQTTLSTRLSWLNQQVTFYKVLGGGWKS